MGIVRSRPNRPRRSVNPPINQPELIAPVQITNSVKALAVMTLTFDQPVSLMRGIVPAYTTDIAGVTALSVVKTAPNIVAVTFSASIAAATKLNIGFRDPAIRSASGGYVTSNTFPV